MNRRKLIFALLFGLIQGHLFFQMYKPDKAVLWLSKDLDGSLSVKSSNSTTEVVMSKFGDDISTITIQQVPTVEHYLLAAIIAGLVGVMLFLNLIGDA